MLEEAKKTEPYGFLVKPFRKKDLQVMLDIAWYRHYQSLEAKSQQENLLQQQLLATSQAGQNSQQKMLEIARIFQAYIPFDLIASGLRPLSMGPFNDKAWLRIGLNEYQFIGEDELLTIANLKRTALSVILANSHTDPRPVIYQEQTDSGKLPVPSLQKTLIDTFQIKSFLVFPVSMGNGLSFHYFFYSRQQGIYTDNHIALLNRLGTCITKTAEALTEGSNQASNISSGATAGSLTQAAERPEFHHIIGKHHLLLAALDLAIQVAPYNTSVLLLGESGTGKEKVAQSIHLLSSRKAGPFIKLNCGAIPPTLIESELFGHEKGAFTGATEKRKGRFELAAGGTLFLDEIGELPLDMQVKLLRVLQEKEIEYVGGMAPVKVDVRIIAATNRNLEQEVAAGNFRLDLYYRLNVFPITLPSLRDRKSDIKALAIYFAQKNCSAFNKRFNGFAATMMEEMIAYDWPGNIRELENVIEQAIILSDGNAALELKRSLTGSARESTPKADVQSLDDIKRIQIESEREYIISILKRTAGRIRGANGAAALLNLKPTTLEARIHKLNIQRNEFTNQ
ncbi:sigma-54-dependent Fis family transcriptional regulator [Paraflavitalea sp. CAU 1676]|uniref:sigma-54 dependent transcriptional regulator n=1 Tax=Paraflavitalea sp. CAU 1676 TaxID=3032598 RepID=UPI0023D9D09A|nr:sigma-54-dependent Fis family transcriptional regulator [Paraflavitalea sp. CAU 1676]MDF2187919.1 sigma-54-dependent Fis family transcriptional regulator [Paraflavitalea sp. CAU 1676]